MPNSVAIGRCQSTRFPVVDDDPLGQGYFAGGFIQGTNLAPVVCDIGAPNLYAAGSSYTANPCTNTAPTANAGGPYSVAEGSTVQLDGTASSDPENAILTYSWSPGTNLSSTASATPIYSGVDDTVDVVQLTVSDVGGDVTPATALTDSDDATVTVTNVAPTVSAVGDAIDEGDTATVSATSTDPGTLDTHTASIDWDDGTPPEAVTVAQLAAGVNHAYGDNGNFDATVTVIDLDVPGIISFPGGGADAVVEAGGEVASSADGTDPGSDDLTFTWSVGDVSTHFNDGQGPDRGGGSTSTPTTASPTSTLTPRPATRDRQRRLERVLRKRHRGDGHRCPQHPLAARGRSPGASERRTHGGLAAVRKRSRCVGRNRPAVRRVEHRLPGLMSDAEATILNPGASKNELLAIEHDLQRVRHDN